MEISSSISSLIFKYLRKDLKTEEADQLQQWIAQSDKNRIFFDTVTQPGYLFEEARDREAADQDIHMDALWQKLSMRVIQQQPLTFNQPLSTSPYKLPTRRIWYAAAAVLLLLVAGGGYFLLDREPAINNKTVAAPTQQQPVSTDVAPGTRKPILTRANGSAIELGADKKGLLFNEDGTAVSSKANGLVYSITREATNELFNTLTVPNGGSVMSLTLSDGTKIWLNAGSSLRYPVAFTGDDRRVTINGEAYFEVAPDKARPFHVMKDNLEVTVLGTHFNVKAFNNEDAVKVTLLEGSVKVANGEAAEAEQTILKPGEQAVVDNTIGITVDNNFDEEVVMAWKNGLFFFDSTDIEVVIRELTRWYDVSIECDNSLKGSSISGQIARNKTLSEVLEELELAETFHFTIKDRKVILTPYNK